MSFPGDSVVENPPSSEGDKPLIPKIYSANPQTLISMSGPSWSSGRTEKEIDL